MKMTNIFTTSQKVITDLLSLRTDLSVDLCYSYHWRSDSDYPGVLLTCEYELKILYFQ
uniref:Uncharacterized protein n=1 Tax=Setaria italica TaxID=4555 RepID=K3Y0S7_SETIT